MSIIFAGTCLVGIFGALIPAHVARLWSRSAAQTAIPDPAPIPCRKQSWYNADRVCLSWTAPRNRK
jgi:hypothetical protein